MFDLGLLSLHSLLVPGHQDLLVVQEPALESLLPNRLFHLDDLGLQALFLLQTLLQLEVLLRLLVELVLLVLQSVHQLLQLVSQNLHTLGRTSQ